MYVPPKSDSLRGKWRPANNDARVARRQLQRLFACNAAAEDADKQQHQADHKEETEQAEEHEALLFRICGHGQLSARVAARVLSRGPGAILSVVLQSSDCGSQPREQFPRAFEVRLVQHFAVEANHAG